jgi:hypothetical protein
MAKSSAERMREYRERRRASGYREVRLWLPDTGAPGFAEECRRQSIVAAESKGEREIANWMEAAQADLDLPPYDD